MNPIRRGVDLAPADIRRGVNDLALQVAQGDHVVVDHAELADAGGGEIHQRRRAQSAGADHQHGGFLQGGLSGTADFAQHNVAGVAFEFVGAQHPRDLPKFLNPGAVVADQADVLNCAHVNGPRDLS